MYLAVCVPYNTNTYALISRTICATIHNNCWYDLGILSFNQDKNALIKVATSQLCYGKCSLNVPYNTERIAHYIIPQLLTLTPCKKRVYSRVRKDYTPLYVYLGCVWVVIYVKYITYEGLLHNTFFLVLLSHTKLQSG